MLRRHEIKIALILIIFIICLANTSFGAKGVVGNWVVAQEKMKYNVRVLVFKPDGAFDTYSSDFQPVRQTGRYYVDFSKDPAWIDLETNGSAYRNEGYLQVLNNNKMIFYTNALIPPQPIYNSGQTIIPKRPLSLDRSVYTITLRRMQ
jgi:hypothetical protein